MLRSFLLAAAVLAALPVQAETRCGWYHNPGPGNVILEDADGQWWISRQGSAPVLGFEDAYTLAFDNRLRLDVQGKPTQRYGSSCVCAEGIFDPSRPDYETVLSIEILREIPLARCEADPNLPPLLPGQ
jgi:Protein of unknown function (DUF4087)